MKNIKIFIPLLLLYIIIIALFASSEYHGEMAFLKFANNISKGYYSDEVNVNLNQGPGYPIFLLPFVILKLPLFTAKLFNSVILFLATQYFYHTLRFYIEKKPAIIATYLLGMYPPILIFLPYLGSEVLAYFLVCGFVYHFSKMYENRKFNWSQLMSASIYLAFLALTRTIFGYVILFGLLFLVFLVFIKQSHKSKKSLLVFLVALFWCSPYLIYTYYLTGNLFYWGTNGGEVLYFMSSPFPNELGNSFSRYKILGLTKKGNYDTEELVKNHIQFYKELMQLSDAQRDKKLKRKAIENIIHYPKAYIKNVIANVGRLLFNYPYSYTPQKLNTYFYIIPNMFLIVIFIISSYASFIGRKMISYELKTLLVISMIYIGGSSLVSAVARYFTIIVPVILLWISFTCSRIIIIKIRN